MSVLHALIIAPYVLLQQSAILALIALIFSIQHAWLPVLLGSLASIHNANPALVTVGPVLGELIYALPASLALITSILPNPALPPVQQAFSWIVFPRLVWDAAHLALRALVLQPRALLAITRFC